MRRNARGDRTVVIWAGFALAALGGCGNVTQSGEPVGNAAVVELKPIDKEGFEKLLAGSDAPVVLVDYWGSWCVQCMKQFPHTVEFHRKYADKGLKVVTLAVEFDTESGPPAALEFLKKQNATFANFVSELEYDDARAAFDVGQFPTYRLFRKGERIANFESGEGHEVIEEAIQKALDVNAME